MKFVITGGVGFIGQNLAIHLREKWPEAKLVAIDWFADAAPEEKAFFDEVHQADFAADATLPLYDDADVVVHLAARTTVQESIQDPLLTFENNVVRTQKLLEHLRHNAPKAHFVFASTGGAIIGDYDGAINEDIVARPLSPYGASKLAVEGLLNAYHGSFGLKYASMRFSNVYGPNSRRKSSVVAAFCKMYLNENRLQINGDGQQTRDYLFVGDVARAIAGVVEHEAVGVFQLGTGVGTSILEIVEIFKGIDPERPLDIVTAPPLAGEVRHNMADIGRIRETIGFEPSYSVADGVALTLDWFKAELGKS